MNDYYRLFEEKKKKKQWSGFVIYVVRVIYLIFRFVIF